MPRTRALSQKELMFWGAEAELPLWGTNLARPGAPARSVEGTAWCRHRAFVEIQESSETAVSYDKQMHQIHGNLTAP